MFVQSRHKAISFCVLTFLVWGLFIQCKSNKVLSEAKESQEEVIKYDKTTLLYFIQEKDLSQVLDLAQKEEKITYVEFYTDWCMPCKIMHETLYMNTIITSFYNDQFINFKINAEHPEGADMAFLYQIEEFPSLLFLDPKGRVISRHAGGISGTDLMLLGENAIQSYDTIRINQ